jgi:hypothetical protein
MPRRRAAGKVMIMLTRRLLVALPVVAALTLPAGAAAATTRFNVKFSGKVVAKWDMPRYQAAQDCHRTTWLSGNGGETWEVQSVGNSKVLAYDYGAGVSFQYGSWTENDPEATRGLEARGGTRRDRTDTIDYTNGTCNILQLPRGADEPKPEKDCGTRLVNYEVDLTPQGNRLAPDVTRGFNGHEKIGYDNCQLIVPSNYVAWTWPLAKAPIKVSEKRVVPSFFGTQKTLTAKGRDVYEDKLDVGGRTTISTTVTVEWTAQFTRVAGPKATKKKAAAKKKGRRR